MNASDTTNACLFEFALTVMPELARMLAFVLPHAREDDEFVALVLGEGIVNGVHLAPRIGVVPRTEVRAFISRAEARMIPKVQPGVLGFLSGITARVTSSHCPSSTTCVRQFAATCQRATSGRFSSRFAIGTNSTLSYLGTGGATWSLPAQRGQREFRDLHPEHF